MVAVDEISQISADVSIIIIISDFFRAHFFEDDNHPQHSSNDWSRAKLDTCCPEKLWTTALPIDRVEPTVLVSSDANVILVSIAEQRRKHDRERQRH
jgi:hypothetical protein